MPKRTRHYATALILASFLVFVSVTVLPGCPSRCLGPDPKAVSIGYELVSRTSSGGGVVRITGVVTNYGQSPYVSAENLQGVYLYEEDQLVAIQEFTNLDIDEDITVSYERTWSTIDELRPTFYTLLVTYSPDITNDRNPDNDDCNGDNNRQVRRTFALDSLFDMKGNR